MQATPVHAALESVFGQESGRVLASLIREVGDFDLAEDVFQDAIAAGSRPAARGASARLNHSVAVAMADGPHAGTENAAERAFLRRRLAHLL